MAQNKSPCVCLIPARHAAKKKDTHTFLIKTDSGNYTLQRYDHPKRFKAWKFLLDNPGVAWSTPDHALPILRSMGQHVSVTGVEDANWSVTLWLHPPGVKNPASLTATRRTLQAACRELFKLCVKRAKPY